MLVGADAVGRLAVGQEVDTGVSTAILSAATGAFTLTGKAVAFDPIEAEQTVAFTLTGNAATFQAQLSATRATYTLTGNAATFQTQLPLTTATFTFTGNAVAFDPIEVEQTVAFTLTGNAATFQTQLSLAKATFTLAGNAAAFTFIATVVGHGTFFLNGFDAFLSYDYDLGGTILQRSSGATFTKKRWRDLLDAEKAERIAELRAAELERQAAIDAAQGAADKARAAVLAARAAQEAANAEQQRIRELAAAIASEQGLTNLQHASHLANAMALSAAHHAHTQRALDNDEDEALSLMLLSHH